MSSLLCMFPTCFHMHLCHDEDYEAIIGSIACRLRKYNLWRSPGSDFLLAGTKACCRKSELGYWHKLSAFKDSYRESEFYEPPQFLPTQNLLADPTISVINEKLPMCHLPILTPAPGASQVCSPLTGTLISLSVSVCWYLKLRAGTNEQVLRQFGFKGTNLFFTLKVSLILRTRKRSMEKE